jgi:hypothetical protein
MAMIVLLHHFAGILAFKGVQCTVYADLSSSLPFLHRDYFATIASEGNVIVHRLSRLSNIPLYQDMKYTDIWWAGKLRSKYSVLKSNLSSRKLLLEAWSFFDATFPYLQSRYTECTVPSISSMYLHLHERPCVPLRLEATVSCETSISWKEHFYLHRRTCWRYSLSLLFRSSLLMLKFHLGDNFIVGGTDGKLKWYVVISRRSSSKEWKWFPDQVRRGFVTHATQGPYVSCWCNSGICSG